MLHFNTRNTIRKKNTVPLSKIRFTHFFLTASNGTILESNRAASDLFGYSPKEFLQLNCWNIIDHTDLVLLSADQEH